MISALFASQPSDRDVYPISSIVFRTILATGTVAFDVISPATTTMFLVRSVSQATWASGSWAMWASRMASEIWSAILSGWPSDTDSDVNRYSFSIIGRTSCRFDSKKKARH